VVTTSRARHAAKIDTGLDRLADEDFERLSDLITDYTGIRLPAAKHIMVEGRLRKRMRSLGYDTLSDYCAFLFKGHGLEQEFTHLVDAVTTNKTDFFREPDHFDVLERIVLPEVLSWHRGSTAPRLKIWSAASSTGAEAYSLAMKLADLSPRFGSFRFSILGTDISTDVLAQASSGIYPAEMIQPVPVHMQRKYVMRARDPVDRNEVRIVPELRRLTRFVRLNLMDESYPFDRDVDIIFLRNVLIYFDKETQAKVIRRLIGHLKPHGFLFLGHSESMIGTDLRLLQIAPAVFQTIGGL
jgi:chemotaxis protein methyltransferase CheR